MQPESLLVEPTPLHTGTEIRPPIEFFSTQPDDLRDAVCAALSSLPEDQRSSVRNALLAELKNAGLRIGESLLMLGASARTADELTAPEIAALIRYVRLAKPKVMTAVAEPLKELLAGADAKFIYAEEPRDWPSPV